jgi:hypothetical protein
MFFVEGNTLDKYLAGCHWCAKGFLYDQHPKDFICSRCKTTQETFVDDRFLNREAIKLIVTGYFIGDSSSETAFGLSRDFKYFSNLNAVYLLLNAK